MKKLIKRPIVVSLLILSFFVFLSWQGRFRVPRDIFYGTTASIRDSAYPFSVKLANLFEFLGSFDDLSRENQKLKQENRKLYSELVNLKQKAEENKFLRSQLGLKQDGAERELILASVTGRVSKAYGNSVLIDKGESEGVFEGAAVITAGDILVGKVIESCDSFSKVQLINGPGLRVHAALQESETKGLIKADEEDGLMVDFLPPDAEIKEGEAVVSSGAAGVIPADLLIGKVKKVVSFESQIAKRALVEAATDLSEVKRVFVIK